MAIVFPQAQAQMQGRRAQSHGGAALLRPLASRFVPFLAPAALLLTWMTVVHLELVSPQVLVSPAQVVTAFADLVRSGELAVHLRKSLVRLALGFAIGASSGLVLGVAMGSSRRTEGIVSPAFRVVRQIPSIALIPALILILGVEESFKIVIVAKATFFPIALATFEGVRQIPRSYLEVAAVNRVPPSVLITKLVIPATIPAVVAGIRTSLGRSWMVLVASELMAADAGLGQMMEMGRQMFRIDIVMVGVFLTGAIGLALDGSVRLLETRLGRWKHL